MKTSSKWFIAALCAAAVATGALVSLRSGSGSAAADRAAAELFYGQSLKDARGVERSLGDWRGKVVVINFWATWCVPCVEEIPAFSRVHGDLGGAVAFVGIGIDGATQIAAFDHQFKPSYPLMVAGATGSDLARAFGDDSGALPFTIVLGPRGEVIARRLGRVDEATLRQWLRPFGAPRS